MLKISHIQKDYTSNFSEDNTIVIDRQGREILFNEVMKQFDKTIIGLILFYYSEITPQEILNKYEELEELQILSERRVKQW